MPKPGALLLNLGSPDSTSIADVRRYLREFLMDERVLDAPAPIRWAVVNLLILPLRPKRSAEAYERVWTPDGSPLIVTSKAVRAALDRPDLPVELAMNYGNPSIRPALERLRDQGVDRLFLLPQYPHYAMSSYETVLVKTRAELARIGWKPQVSILQPFYRDPDYIGALVESARESLAGEWDAVLFSFHGIPERHLRKTDPSHAHCLASPDCCTTCHPAHATCYRHQCFETVRAFTEAAGIDPSRVHTSFQSRLGRDPWLTPYTDKTLLEFPERGIKRLLVLCPAFVADCLETLEEIAMEGRESFLEAGGESFRMIPCLNENPAWIQVLRDRLDAFAAS